MTKKNQPKRDARRRQIVEEIKNGTPKGEIAEKLQVSRWTLWRDLTALDDLFVMENSAEIKELKRRVARALLESADNVLTGDLAPDKANAWRAIMSDFSELFGLNAPRRTESVNVNVEADPQKLGPYQWFCYISRDLSFEEIKGPVAEVCDRLRSQKEPEPMPQPPKDSPLWHPAAKELSE
jgi:HTH domain